jgi:hypothetical protein
LGASHDDASCSSALIASAQDNDEPAAQNVTNSFGHYMHFFANPHLSRRLLSRSERYLNGRLLGDDLQLRHTSFRRDQTIAASPFRSRGRRCLQTRKRSSATGALPTRCGSPAVHAEMHVAERKQVWGAGSLI